jgi:hypothetical protein
MKTSLKQITDALLDEKVDIGEEGNPQLITKREALLMRIVQDAIGDEDPAIRQKAAALVLNIIDFAAEKEPARKSTIKNKNGKEI